MTFVNAWIIPDPVVLAWGFIFGVLISYIVYLAFTQSPEEST